MAQVSRLAHFAVPAILAGAMVSAPGGSAIAASRAMDRQKLHGNNFYVNCRFSHTADDDPIVHPRQPGKSHPHTFFGNESTDAFSTLASLRKAGTTCKPAADKGAYWIPTLYKEGREVRPAKAQFYYNLRGYDQMHPFPPGLRILAGNAHAVRPQSPAVTYWACGGAAGERTAPLRTVPNSCADHPIEHKKGILKACPTCPPQPLPHPSHIKTFLELHVNFPDCWDGKHLDSADHKSHMAYSRNYVCPASHPAKVPLIRLMVRYPIADGRGVVLASGLASTAHADFFNAWDDQALTKLVNDCFHDRPCNEPSTKPSR